MKKNMATADRALRGVVAAGAVAGSGVLGFSTAWGVVLLAVAAIMAVTAASGYCPLYSLLGIRTLGPHKAEGGGHQLFHLRRAA